MCLSFFRPKSTCVVKVLSVTPVPLSQNAILSLVADPSMTIKQACRRDSSTRAPSSRSKTGTAHAGPERAARMRGESTQIVSPSSFVARRCSRSREDILSNEDAPDLVRVGGSLRYWRSCNGKFNSHTPLPFRSQATQICWN